MWATPMELEQSDFLHTRIGTYLTTHHIVRMCIGVIIIFVIF